MLWRPPRRSWCMHRILCTACNRNSTRSFERGHDGNILEEAYRGRYARQRLLNFWPESSCGYHAIKRFVCIIQVSARNWGSDYIWHAHYPAAVKGGLDPSVPADVAAGRKPTKLKADEAIIYNLLSEIYRDNKLSDATYNSALAKYGEKGITDIIGLAAYYGITAMALITANAPTAPGDEPKLQSLTQVVRK